MTRIQMRRDTAANWASNNPTPFAGEPCFETDTGKLKIGDGSTAYNDLAYQGDVASLEADVSALKTTKQDKLTAGDNITIDEETNTISATGSSTPDNMVTIDTDQTITGIKTFIPSDTVSSGIKPGLVIGGMRLGTNTAVTPLPVISGNSIKIVNATGSQIASFSSAESITFGNGTSTMSLNLLANTVNLKAGSSINYVGNLQVGTKTLKYTSATGDTTDLLAGGSSDSLVKSVDSNFSVSDSGQLSLADTLSVGSSVTTDTLTASSQVGTPAVRFGWYGGAYVRPEITYDTTDGMKINARAIESTGNVMKPVTVIASEFKAGDNTNQYDVVTKSADNNTYMAHMAMPSDTYVDLTLGASGTTYTAPADGYIYLRRYSTSSNTVTNAYIQVFTDEGRFDSRAMQNDWTKDTGGEVYLFIPIRKDKSFTINYRDFSSINEDSTFTRFFYAVGSEPSS